MEILRVAASVEARNARDDDHVPPSGQEGGGGAQPHLLDLGIDREVFFDIGVRRGQVSLGLVIVVIGDEIFDGVLREKVFELPVKLRRQRLVMAQHERRAVDFLNHVGDREGLARAGHAQQRVVL